MIDRKLSDPLIQDEAIDADDSLPHSASAIPGWGRVALAAGGAALAVARLAAAVHGAEDDGHHANFDAMSAQDDQAAQFIHDSGSPDSVASPKTVKSPRTVSPATADTVSPATATTTATALTTGTAATGTGATATTATATAGSAATLDSPTAATGTGQTTAEVAGVKVDATAQTATGQTSVGIGALVSAFASGRLTEAQAKALAPLLKGGLSASDVKDLHVNEFVQALKAAGMTDAQVKAVLSAS